MPTSPDVSRSRRLILIFKNKRSYVYKVTHGSGKFYIGSRSPQNQHIPLEEDLWVRYFTSSKYVHQLIETDGTSSFTPEIIKIFEDYDSAYWFEQELIQANFKNSLCMNRSYRDRTSGHKKFSTRGISPSREQRIKIGNVHRGARRPHTEKQNRLIGDAQRGKPKQKTKKRLEALKKFALCRLGKSHSEETKTKIGAAHKGRKLPRDQVLRSVEGKKRNATHEKRARWSAAAKLREQKKKESRLLEAA